jgi:hypothetical protein
MAPPRGRLQAAGYVPIPGTSRHYRSPSGKEVSYRQAFAAARGESLEAAVKDRGKFARELRLAEQVRELARTGELVGRGLVSPRQERTLATKTLRQLTRGHYSSEATKAGLAHTLERRTVYSKAVLAILNARPEPVVARPNESGASIEARVRAEELRVNGPNSPKALLLVALGRRQAGADYDVGDSPP